MANDQIALLSTPEHSAVRNGTNETANLSGDKTSSDFSYLKVTQGLAEKVVAISGLATLTFGHPHSSDILKLRRCYWNAGLLEQQTKKSPERFQRPGPIREGRFQRPLHAS